MSRFVTVDRFVEMFSLELIDILTGVEYDLIDTSDVEDLATRYHDVLAKVAGSSDFLVEMSLLDTTEGKVEVVEKYADLDRVKLSTRKWLYAELVALYERQDEVDDVLVELEMIWAGFDYDERIRHLIYYLPADDVERAQRLGKENIFKDWRRYLRDEGQALSARTEVLDKT